MNVVQLTPGAGGMYCGNCFRDNALVKSLLRKGHSAQLLPMYLPLTLEDQPSTADIPIFYGGLNVYLEQRFPAYRSAPRWLHSGLSNPSLLQWIGRFAAKTRAEEVGDLTLSMLAGEQGNQRRELKELIRWLKQQARPDVVCLSNCLLSGVTRQLRAELGVPVVCMLQGEDSFLDALPPQVRQAAWKQLAERVAESDALVAPSRYFADLMRSRLELQNLEIRIVHNGISLDGYGSSGSAASSKFPRGPGLVLGYFARMCQEKGLDSLVEAFVLLKRSKRFPLLHLRIGGGCSSADEPFVARLRTRLQSEGLLGEVEFHPNLSREDKIAFLESLDVFSVPAMYGEAFGLYLVEAMAAGVPVVQPRHAAFPEVLTETGGGVLYDPPKPESLAMAIESLLLDEGLRKSLGQSGRQSVQERFSADAMGDRMLEVMRSAMDRFRAGDSPRT
jgi:glycosyltransferase involved in cell wall biosynthesis